MKILDSLYNSFSEYFEIKKEEFEKIFYLQLFSFFLGFFVAFYFVPANAEFVKYYGSAQLPFAYIISGIVGTIVLLGYSWLQKRTSSKNLFTSALIITLTIALLSRLLTLLLRLDYFASAPELTLKLKQWISFFVFIWAWPFIALTATVTGGLALRLFNLLEVKRFYGIINLGGVAAAIISYFSIPLFINRLSHQYDLIIIGSLGILAAIILLHFIYIKFPEKAKTQKVQKKVLSNFLKNFTSKSFILWIFIGAAFSIIAIYIADYGFLITIKNSSHIFPDNQAVARYMSLVFGALKIGEFLISVFSGRLLSKWGVRFGLLMLPITITFFETAGLLAAYTIGISSIVFLGIMTANKMFERIIRRGVDDPSFNVLYQTLPDDFKLFIQTRVGLIQQFSISLAGVLLAVLHYLLFRGGRFNLELYPLATLPFLIVWIIVALKLYGSYKNRIREILAQKKLFKLEYIEKDIFALDVLQKYLLTDDMDIAKFSVVVLSETNPRALENYANVLLKVDNAIIRKAILNNIDATYNERLVKTIEQIGNQIGFKERELRKLILKALFQLDYTEVGQYSFDQIQQLINSNNSKDKILACKYLFKNTLSGDEKLISQLLDNEEKEIKLAAIKIAAKRNNPLLNRKLISLLTNSQYNNLLINILIELGENVIDDLDKYFTSQHNIDVQKKIIQILAKIGTTKAKRILLKHIDYPDRQIQQSVIEALFYSDYFATSEEEKELIKRKIYQIVDNILWLYIAIKDTVKEKNTLKLIQALDLELEITKDHLFTLLTFIHQKEIIDLIKANIIGENTIFAIELIDNFIDFDIKRVIIPLFEKINIGQKIKKLRKQFPHRPLGFYDRLKDILIKDFSKVDIWSKVKAVELLGKLLPEKINIENINLNQLTPLSVWTTEQAQEKLTRLYKKQDDFPYEFILMLLNPNDLIFTTAAKILISKYGQEALKLINSLPQQRRDIIMRSYEKKDFLIDRIKLLKRIYLFYTIPEKSLVELAKLMRNYKTEPGSKVYFQFEDNQTEDIIIVVKGKLTYENAKEKLQFQRNDVIIRGVNIPQKAQYLEVAKNANLIFINRFDFFNLLAMDNDLVTHLIDRMEF